MEQQFYKLIPPSLCSMGYSFVPGWNRDLPGKNGLHFATLPHVFDHQLEHRTDLRMWWLARVFVDEQEVVEVVRFHFRCRCIYLCNFVRVQDHLDIHRICSYYPPLLLYITLTPALVEQVIALNGSALEFVPDTMKTYRLVLMAVKDNMNMLQFVPDCFMTDDLVVPLLDSNGLLIRHVNSPSFAMITHAVRQNSEAFNFINFRR